MKRRGIPRISRRVLLGGGATLFGLPFLESALSRAARAQERVDPVRLLFVFLPNGLDMATFRPATSGADYELSPMLAGLADHKPDFTVVTGLENVPAKPDGPGDHASGTSSFITCAHANKSETEIKLGISADQVAATKIPGLPTMKSLQLGIDGGGGSGNCDSGYSCAYTRNISWSDATTPLPKIIDPRQAFDELFKGFDPNVSAAEAEKRRAYDKSVIDAVLGDVQSLKPKLGSTDQKKLEQYLTGVRELENRLVAMGPTITCTPGMPPPGRGDLDYPQQITAMMDVIALAFACDATRIVTLMFGNALSGRTHPFLGINGGHHDISHHGNDAGAIAELAKIGKWEMDQIGYFMTKLKAVAEAEEKTALYNSAVFVSSDISDGNRHNHDDMPIVLAGHAGGALLPGKHVAYPRENGVPREKVSNLLVTMLKAAGVPDSDSKLGDSTGPLTDLMKS